MTPRVPSFKVSQGHRNRHESICHLRLPITSTNGAQQFACVRLYLAGMHGLNDDDFDF